MGRWVCDAPSPWASPSMLRAELETHLFEGKTPTQRGCGGRFSPGFGHPSFDRSPATWVAGSGLSDPIQVRRFATLLLVSGKRGRTAPRGRSGLAVRCVPAAIESPSESGRTSRRSACGPPPPTRESGVEANSRRDERSLDSVAQLSERATRPTAGHIEEAMHLLFAFAPFVTFILLGLHLFQIGEVVSDEHAPHH